MVTLQSLPEEVIYSIGGHLPPHDVCSLRETCRDVSLKIFSRFKRACFQRLHVTFAPRRIKTLVQIAEHASFGPEVRELVIRTTPTPEENAMADADVVDDLVLAMNYLRNCKSLILADKNATQESDSSTQTTYRPRRLSITDRLIDRLFLQHVLHAMLTAAVLSENPVETASIHLIPAGEQTSNTVASPYSLLDPPLEQVTRRGSLHSLRSVTTLHLFVPQLSHLPTYYLVAGWFESLGRFLEFFPNVSHLSLDFHDHILDSDAGTALCVALSALRLKKLDLGYLVISEEYLSELILQHQSTLEKITLRQISMRHQLDDWSTMVGKMEQLPRLCRVDLIACNHFKFDIYLAWFVNSHIGDFLIEGKEDFQDAIADLRTLEAMERDGEPYNAP